MIHAIAPIYFATGAQHERDMVGIRMGSHDSAALLAGGPLDAPSFLPAGSHNSTDVRDFRGQAVPHQTTNYRDFQAT